MGNNGLFSSEPFRRVILFCRKKKLCYNLTTSKYLKEKIIKAGYEATEIN